MHPNILYLLNVFRIFEEFMLKYISKITIFKVSKLFFIFSLLSLSAMSVCGMKPDNLRCEYLVTPLGVDVKAPRLSWIMQDERQGAKQAAWHIVVGTDSALVANGIGDVWDSKKVISDKMMVVYDGKELQPFTRYYWTVRIWDGYGEVSDAVASWFETGVHPA